MLWQPTEILIAVVILSVCLQSVCNHHISGDNFDLRKATVETLKNEQRIDKSLAHCWSLAERDKAGYFVKDGILYRHQKLYVDIRSVY